MASDIETIETIEDVRNVIPKKRMVKIPARLRYLGDDVEPYVKISDDPWLRVDVVGDKGDLDLSSRKKIQWRCRRCKNKWNESVATRKRYEYCPNCQIRKHGKCLSNLCNIAPSYNYKQYNWKAYCKKHSDKIGLYHVGMLGKLPGKYLSDTRPDLCEEWDYELNEKGPEKYTYGSNYKAAWVCKNNICGCHKWHAPISRRTNGVGCPYCNSRLLCKHNNLLNLKPDLCKEWDYEKNEKGPENYTVKNGAKVHWKCIKASCECHRWESTILNRVVNGSGCPYCTGKKVCKHGNLVTSRPDLAKQWDYERNEKLPEEYSSHSAQIVHWICEKSSCGCHKWTASISDRNYYGCPYCARKKVCEHDNFKIAFPLLSEEWDYEKNVKGPENYNCYSGQIVHWICKNNICGCHRWSATISSRVNGNGCPYCSGMNPCEHVNLLLHAPKLCEEWDYEKNVKGPEKYTSHSGQIVHWICKNNICGCHRWMTDIKSRIMGNGCPYCSGKNTCDHNNLLLWSPKLCEEWNYELNEKGPENYTTHSSQKINWICQKGHKWITAIVDRSMGTGCPKCSKAGYSKAQIEWLDEIMRREGIHIHHAVNGGEFYIEGIGKVDGYCSETNTVYEYHGDYWHGNPKVYYGEAINKSYKITFGELYKRTLVRDNKIRDLGYNLVVQWETE